MAHGEVTAKYKTALHLKLVDAAVAVIDGVWMDAGLYELGKFDISGISNATVTINGSNDAAKPADATHGRVLGTATADGFVEILVMPRWIKARVSVWVAGTISVLAMLRTAR